MTEGVPDALRRYLDNLPKPGPVETTVPVPAPFQASIAWHDDLGEIEIAFAEPPLPGEAEPQRWTTLLQELPGLHLRLLAERHRLAEEFRETCTEARKLRDQIARLGPQG